MRLKIVILVVAVVAIGGLIFGYVEMSKEQAVDASADQPISAVSHVESGADGETVLHFDLDAQKLIGLQTAVLAAVVLPPEIAAYGRVLDSAALVGLHNDLVTAQAALQVSQPEFERLKKLNAQDNASAHALEMAAAELARDQGALNTAKIQLAAAAGAALGDKPDVFFQALSSQETVLVRLDLPAGEDPAETPVGAQLILPGSGLPVAADYLGRAATTDPQVQGVGFLFSVTNAPPVLAAGLAITGFLKLPDEPARGAVVPDSAVVRSEEHAWIYVQTGETNFVRREMTVNCPAPGGWFVTNMVSPGDKVVVTGAQTLLSEEHKTEIKMGD